MNLTSVKISLVLFGLFLSAASSLHADKSWSNSSVKLIQTKLNDIGYSAGPVDGAWGRKTSAALSLYCEEYEHDCSGGEQTVIDLLTTDTDDSYLDVEMDFASAVWFENRIGYGAPKDRVDRYVGMTRREAIALVVQELKDHQDPFELPSWFYEMKPLGYILQTRDGRTCDTTHLKVSLKQAWLSALYQSEVPQFDRLSTFWLDHFSVGYDAYEHPHAFSRHLQFVRDWKDKSFPDLLYASLSDPSTIVYLNNDKSDRNTPNENLAREFFELFALGEGNYSEEDIREFAKLLTGRAFNIAGETYHFMNERAIKPNAKIFGKRYKKAETFVQSLKDHPNYGHFIIQKFYNEYVSLDDVSDRQMRLLKHRFLKNEQSILDLFESIISHKDFWNMSGQLTLIKSPLELFAGTSRTLNTTGMENWNSNNWAKIAYTLKQFEQDLFDPLSIDGWPEGKEWLQGSALDRRSNDLKILFTSDLRPSAKYGERRAVASWNYLKKSKQKDEDLSKFFASAKKGQVLVQDIIVQSEKNFTKDKPFALRIVFNNVRLNSRVYDQILTEFFYCPHCSDDDRNLLILHKEAVPKGFLKNARYVISDGDTVDITFSLPLSAKPQKNLGTNEYKTIRNLARVVSILFDKRFNHRFRSEINRMGPEGRKWLESIVTSSGRLVDVYDTNSPIRLFDPDNLSASGNDTTDRNYFDCNSQNGKAQQNLDEYFDYKLLAENYAKIPEDEFRDHLSKIWKDKESTYDTNLANYLLPEFAKSGEPIYLSDIFSLVEYNLR